MPTCAVANCLNSTTKRNFKDPTVKYYSFPKQEKLAKLWINACGRQNEINLKCGTICSMHFDQNCFEIPLKHKLLNYFPKNARYLKDDAVPTLNLPYAVKLNSEERPANMVKKICKESILENSTANSFLVMDDIKTTIDISEIKIENIETRDIPELRLMHDKSTRNLQENSYYSQLGELQKKVQILESENRNLVSQDELRKREHSICQGELEEMRKKVIILESQNNNLLQQTKEIRSRTCQEYNTILKKVFTPGQIRQLFNSSGDIKRVRWSTEDIASAISLQSVSTKAYRYLKANNYPLPGMSTLRNWAGKFDVDEGILKDVITLMKERSADFSVLDRLAVVLLDEICVSNKMDIVRKKELVVGPHKTCQTVMVRGLTSNWKQPIYYAFDTPMRKEIIDEIISKLYEANFIVVAISSSIGPSTLLLWDELNIGHKKNCFMVHPCDKNLKIFGFANVLNLMNLVRNHLIDEGFIIDNKLINVDYFEALLDVPQSELSSVHKMTKDHIKVKGSTRNNARSALQLLSNSVAEAMKVCGEMGIRPEKTLWNEASDMVQLFNDWFDVFNSCSESTLNSTRQNSYGTNLDHQKNTLDQMITFIKSMRVGKHGEMIPFQEGILQTSRSLSEMYDYLKKNYNLKYIFTSRLNLDVLDNFFSSVQGTESGKRHVTPLEFRYRLRWYVLGKHPRETFTENQDTTAGSDKKCLPSDSLNSSRDLCLTDGLLSNLTNNEINLEKNKTAGENEIIIQSFEEPCYLEGDCVNEEVLQFLPNFEVTDEMSQESLKYLAGFVAFKFKNKYSLGKPNTNLDMKKAPDWIPKVSNGYLCPNEELWEVALTLESEFNKFHGKFLSKEEKIFRKLANNTMTQLSNTSVAYDVVLYFSKTRTYIRLMNLNKVISSDNTQRKPNRKLS